MPATYRAVIEGEQVQWVGVAPVCQKDVPLLVRVQILERQATPDRGRRMAAALAATARTFRPSVNPRTWQRQARRDRSMPGRVS